MAESRRLDRLTSMMRRRGIVLPSFEIYGGIAGLIDYGPVGARIKRKVIDSWINHWTSGGDIVEIDSPTITPRSVLVASGHVGEFNDHMSECNSCKSVFRSDHLIEGLHPKPCHRHAATTCESAASLPPVHKMEPTHRCS